MIDAAAQARLQELFRRENRSFLQYINQATPWASAGDRSLVDKIQQLAAEELEALEQLAHWLDARRIPLPYLGEFPTNFTSFNFVDIRKLLKPLVVEQKKELADLETDAKSLMDQSARIQVDTLVELNRKHLQALEELSQPQSA